MKHIVFLLLLFSFAFATQLSNVSTRNGMITLCSDTKALLVISSIFFFLVGAVLGIVWIVSLKFTKKENRIVKLLGLIIICLFIISTFLYFLAPHLLSLWVSPPSGAAPNYNPCDPQFLPYDKNCTSEGINCTRIMY